MDDLFPGSLQPDAIGFDAVRLLAPVFFAIYPSAADLPRVVAWQRRLCGQAAPSTLALRPPGLLHVSVAACGAPRRQRQPLQEALRAAAVLFACPSFELRLDAIAGFDADGRAFVALADAGGTRTVHGLRLALADAQRRVGLVAARGMSEAHLTLGYGDGVPAGRRPAEPLAFRVESVDLVASLVGHSEHVHLDRWRLR